MASPTPPATRRTGDEWAASRRWLALAVRGALVPDEHNVLLNPAHPGFRAVSWRFDARLR